MRRRTVQIVLTERCNLHCSYCYERERDFATISEERVRSIITEAFAAADGCDMLVFYFHGGEIGLVFPLLRRVCAWLWSRAWPKRYVCNATTNGTLLHGEMQTWFYDNRARFVLGLSLDGTRAMHETNRPGSYDRIDFAFFRRTWPQVPCKMTISQATLPTLAEGVAHIHGMGFQVTANLAYAADWTEALVPAYRRELAKLADYYLSHPQCPVSNLLARALWVVGRDAPAKRRKWCGTGEHMVCFAQDGVRYPCQCFMPSGCGMRGRTVFCEIDFSDAERFVDPDCAGCAYEAACPTCYAFNFSAQGDVARRSRVLCRYRRVEAVAAATLLGRMLSSGAEYAHLANLSPARRAEASRGVVRIYRAFSDEVKQWR